jgi:Glycosyl transferases group 1
MRNKWQVVKNLAFTYGPGRKFKKFEASVHPDTWAKHEELLTWAESMAAQRGSNESVNRFENSNEPVVRQGYELIQKVKQEFKDSYRQHGELRILFHVPTAAASGAYASFNSNFVQGFQFVGITARELSWADNTGQVLEGFKPTLLLTVDHEGHLQHIDWEAVREYRKKNSLRLALNASLQEYGNTPLKQRLDWAEQNHVDFYYSHKTDEYNQTRYQEIIARGYKILSLEFGTNPFVYYPVPGIERDVKYAFLASTNPDKWPRYYAYFGRLWREHAGYIDGPWWSSISRFGGPETHRYVWARTKVGLNLHIPLQINWLSELNERTYNLASCGIPQLVDEPKLLSSRFSDGCFFVAATPKDYLATFERMLEDTGEGEKRALKAQREVFAKHTVFHRAANFVDQLGAGGFLAREGARRSG